VAKAGRFVGAFGPPCGQQAATMVRSTASPTHRPRPLSANLSLTLTGLTPVAAVLPSYSYGSTCEITANSSPCEDDLPHDRAASGRASADRPIKGPVQPALPDSRTTSPGVSCTDFGDWRAAVCRATQASAQALRRIGTRASIFSYPSGACPQRACLVHFRSQACTTISSKLSSTHRRLRGATTAQSLRQRSVSSRI
jgi:hypothetical protein